MGMVFIIAGAGLCTFLSVYLGFNYWKETFGVGYLRVRDDTAKIFEELFIQKTPDEVLKFQATIAGAAAALVFIVFFSSPIFAVIMAALTFHGAWRAPLFYLKMVAKPQRVAKFSLQMIDALTLMGNGLKSGLNIPQTLQIVVDEMPAPIKEEFGLVLNENKLGLTLEKAFENLGRRIDSEDVSMFVTSVNILRETGGNIAETFETITKTIRDRLKLQAKISAMTAQGMMSAIIVGAMPPLMGVIMFANDPVAMKPMFTTIPGYFMLLVVAVLEALGFFVIMKIIRIRV